MMNLKNRTHSSDSSLFYRILSLSGPISLSLLVQALYNIVDSFYVSRYSPDGLTALSLAFPVQLFIIALGTGTSTGCGIVVSYYLGENRMKKAANAAIHGFPLSLLQWLVFALLSVPFVRLYFSLFSEKDTVRSMGITYTTLICLFCLFQFIENTSSRILYSENNSLGPTCAQICGVLINILLDPLLIFGAGPFPSLGVAGAAVATVTAQFFSMFLSLCFLAKGSIKLTADCFSPSLSITGSIYKAGFPTFFMQSLVSVYVSGLNMVLKPFGEFAIMSLGIYYKLQTFLLMPTNSLSLAVTPLMSYYYGKKDIKTMWQVYRQSLLLSFFTMLAGTLLFWIFPRQLITIFSTDAALFQTAVPALRIISLSFPFFSFTIIIPVLLQVTGYTKENLMITFLRQIVFLVPFAWILSHFGLEAVWITFPLSEILAAILSWRYKVKIQKRLHKMQ